MTVHYGRHQQFAGRYAEGADGGIGRIALVGDRVFATGQSLLELGDGRRRRETEFAAADGRHLPQQRNPALRQIAILFLCHHGRVHDGHTAVGQRGFGRTQRAHHHA